VTPLHSASHAKQVEAIRVWDQQTTRRLIDEGQAIIAGNYNHPKDLLSTIAARDRWDVMKRPALHIPGNIEEAPEDYRDPEAIETLPEKWPKRRLYEEAADSPGTFPVVYLLRSSTSGAALLREHWVRRIDPSENPPDRPRLPDEPRPGPGRGGRPRSVVLHDHRRHPHREHLDVIESYADRIPPTEQAEVLSAKVAHYRERGHVGGIAVSKVALDRYAKGGFEIATPRSAPAPRRTRCRKARRSSGSASWAATSRAAGRASPRTRGTKRPSAPTTARGDDARRGVGSRSRLSATTTGWTGSTWSIREARSKLGDVSIQKLAEMADMTPSYDSRPAPTDGERIMSANW
jgi:hypothetical protein